MISVYTALLMTFPFTLYQLYSYLIPAFSQETSKRLKPLLMFIPLLFLAGAAFGYYVVVPVGRALPLLLGLGRGQPAAARTHSTRSR